MSQSKTVATSVLTTILAMGSISHPALVAVAVYVAVWVYFAQALVKGSKRRWPCLPRSPEDFAFGIFFGSIWPVGLLITMEVTWPVIADDLRRVTAAVLGDRTVWFRWPVVIGKRAAAASAAAKPTPPAPSPAEREANVEFIADAWKNSRKYLDADGVFRATVDMYRLKRSFTDDQVEEGIARAKARAGFKEARTEVSGQTAAVPNSDLPTMDDDAKIQFVADAWTKAQEFANEFFDKRMNFYIGRKFTKDEIAKGIAISKARAQSSAA